MTLPPFEPKHPALRSLYWREEVLEVALWLRGEGLGDGLEAPVLARFLDCSPEQAAEHLLRLAQHGYLRRLDGGAYELTPAGEAEADRLVRQPRIVPLPTVGGCGAACWCSISPVEAARCRESRAG